MNVDSCDGDGDVYKQCQNIEDPLLELNTCLYMCPCSGTQCHIMLADTSDQPADTMDGTVPPLCEVYFALKVPDQ